MTVTVPAGTAIITYDPSREDPWVGIVCTPDDPATAIDDVVAWVLAKATPDQLADALYGRIVTDEITEPEPRVYQPMEFTLVNAGDGGGWELRHEPCDTVIWTTTAGIPWGEVEPRAQGVARAHRCTA